MVASVFDFVSEKLRVSYADIVEVSNMHATFHSHSHSLVGSKLTCRAFSKEARLLIERLIKLVGCDI